MARTTVVADYFWGHDLGRDCWRAAQINSSKPLCINLTETKSVDFSGNNQVLNGISVLITRPVPACHELATAVATLGGTPIVAPMIAIGAYVDDKARESLATNYPHYYGVIFISTNAVDFGLPELKALGKDPKPLFAVGNATAERIRQYCPQNGASSVKFPENLFNSEGLLELPDFAENLIGGKRILIVRGHGGRELLADTLTRRGAQVDYFEVYKRHPTNEGLGDILSAADILVPSIGVITSLEGLSNLVSKIAKEQLQSLLEMPLIVPSRRIAEQVRNHGFTKPPLIADNPAQENIIARLKRWVVEKI